MSYATVPVVAFTILSNFLWFCEPSNITFVPYAFIEEGHDTCGPCRRSICHQVYRRPCITRFNDTKKFICNWCTPKYDLCKEYNFEEECWNHCTNTSMTCVCADWYYICRTKEFINEIIQTESLKCFIGPDTPTIINCV